MWGAIAVLGIWECDSEALRRNRSLGVCGSAIAFGVWECDRFWGCGSAIAVWEFGGNAIAVLGCGDAIAVWGCGDAIAVLGMWECDRCLGM